MKIRINSIRFHNIRSFQNVEIDFSNNITVIMMPNGTGKTTTIDLMTAALIGEIPARDVSSYRPHYGHSRTGYFIMKVTLNESKYTIRIDFDFVKYKAQYSYTDTLTGIENDRPIEFKKIFNKYFVDKFIFDGEVPAKFMSPDSTYTEESIMSLYNLKKLSDLNKKITTIKGTLIEENSNTTAEHQSGLKRTSNDIDKLEAIKVELNNKLSAHKAKIKKISSEIIDMELRIAGILSEDKDLITKIDNNKMQIKGLEVEIGEINKQISRHIKYIHNLSFKTWSENTNLIDVLVNMKLPSSISEQFFVDLINQGTKCICGRDFDNESKSYLEEHYKHHLEENNIGILNEIKSYSRTQNYTELLNELKNKLVSKMEKVADLKNDVDQLQLSGDIDRSEIIGGLNREIGRLQKERDSIKKEIDFIESPDSKDKDNNLHAVEKRLRELYEKLNEIKYNKLINENQKLLRNIIDKFQYNILLKIKADLVKSSNIKLNKIIDNDEIEIRSIDKYIKISNREGVSVGQSLSVAYSFISTLFERSDFDIPFVIDSPAGSLDNSYRREVAQILPRAFNQLILFVISSEKQSFIDEFELNSTLDVKYLTIFKENEEIIINDNKLFFDQFQEKKVSASV